MDNKSLKKFGDLVEKKLKPIKKQLGSVDTKLGSVDKRFNGIDKRLDTLEMKIEVVNNRLGKTEQELKQTILKSQEDTMEALSELIHTGYNNHEKRIRKIENHLQLPQST